MPSKLADRIRKMEQVTADELAFATALGSAVAAGKVPQSGVGHLGVNFEFDHDGVQRIGLTDIPENRAMIAIRDQFSREKFQPLMFRLWALAPLMEDEENEPFVRYADDGSGMIEVHPAVYEIAGRMPLNSKGHFTAATYFRQVRLRAHEIDQKSDAV